MNDFTKRHKNSILAEWVLKIALIFFVASIFFDDTALEFTKDDGGALTIMTYIKMALIVAFGIVIAAISQAAFKIVGFTTIIVGAFFKLIMTISVSTFSLVDSINLADEILLIAMAFFYLYRHYRHEKKAKKVVKKRKTRTV
ncbi:MAG: hypothetical protein DRI84_01715 [Bacteroidetes bacterium]|nr:MAG: hypothetical protein DRI84_01715 [Bacteroidota bacterium]